MYIIVNKLHPAGPTVLVENDRGLYSSLREAERDAVFVSRAYDNPGIEVYELGEPVSRASELADWRLCPECDVNWIASDEDICPSCGES